MGWVFLIAIVTLLASIIWGFYRSHYRIEREMSRFSDPPRVHFAIYGRWPHNLICYGVCATEAEAIERVKALDAAMAANPPA